jgi:hypothetical protein
MTVKKLLEELDSKEISEWMAYDLTQNQKWLDKYKNDKELEESRAMSLSERAAAFKRLLKGSK